MIVFRVIKNLIITFALLLMLLIILLLLGGSIPVNWVIERMPMHIQSQVIDASGNMSSGRAIIRSPYFKVNLPIRWERQGISQWRIATESDLIRGRTLAASTLTGIRFSDASFSGNVQATLQANSALAFSYEAMVDNVDLDWMLAVQAIDGELQLNHTSILESNVWKRVGNYLVDVRTEDNLITATFEDHESEVTVDAAVGETNAFNVDGKATVTLKPPAYPIQIQGAYRTDGSLRFPYFIPITQPATENGQPFNILFDLHSQS